MKRIGLILILLATCATLTAQEGKKNLDACASFEKELRWDQAISCYEKLVGSNVDTDSTMRAKIRLGWIHLQQKNDVKTARPYFDDAGKSKVADIAAEAAVDDGVAVLKSATSEKDFDTALGDFDLVIRTYPNTSAVVSALISGGTILELKHDYDRATINYQSVISKFPDSDVAPEAFIRLGRVLGKQGRVNSALEAYQTVQLRYAQSSWAKTAKDEATLLYRLFLLKSRSPAIFKPTTIATKSNTFKLDDPSRLDWIPAKGTLQILDKEHSFSVTTSGETAPGDAPTDFIDSNQKTYQVVKSTIMAQGDQRLPVYYIKDGDIKKEHRSFDQIVALAVNQYGDTVVGAHGPNGLFKVNRQTGDTNPFGPEQKEFKAKKIAVDSEGDFYALNSDGTTVTMFDARGKVIGSLQNQALGIKKEIADFALDTFDNIYLLDNEGHYVVTGGLHQTPDLKLKVIHRQDINGEPGKLMKDLRGLAVLPNGDVFVVSKQNVMSFR